MMLQIIHQIEETARASSIYCRWIRGEQREGSPLIAVWIDNKMRVFEREFTSHSNFEPSPKRALEEPGGAPVRRTVNQRTSLKTKALYS